MKELFVPYHIAKLAKEKGFDEPCLCTYTNQKLTGLITKDILNQPCNLLDYVWKNSHIHEDNIAAPLYQQLIDWFREKYNIHIYELPTLTKRGFCFKANDFNKKQTEPGSIIKTVFGDSYYESLNKALEEAFKLI